MFVNDGVRRLFVHDFMKAFLKRFSLMRWVAKFSVVCFRVFCSRFHAGLCDAINPHEVGSKSDCCHFVTFFSFDAGVCVAIQPHEMGSLKNV